jgi:hypothetical protein
VTINLPEKIEAKAPPPRQFVMPTISPSLDPRAIIIPPEGDQLLEECQAAMGIARKHADDMLTAARAAHGHQMLTPAAQHVAAANASDKIAKPGLMAIDRANERLQAQIEVLRKKTFAPPAPPDLRSEMRAKEIREALSRMTDAARRKALDDALAEQCADTLAALLTGPRIATGLSKIELDTFRERWRHMVLPAECKRLAALEKAQVALLLGGKILLEASFAAFDPHVVSAAQKSQAAAQSAIAAAGGVTH